MTLKQQAVITATVEFVLPVEDAELAYLFTGGYDPLTLRAVQLLQELIKPGQHWSVQRAVAEKRLIREEG